MSFCTLLPISTKRRQTFSRNEIALSTSASLGRLELRLAALCDARTRRTGYRQPTGQKLLLQRCILALQAGNLHFQRRAFVGYHLARPAGIGPAALRDLAGAGVEPQHAEPIAARRATTPFFSFPQTLRGALSPHCVFLSRLSLGKIADRTPSRPSI